MNILSQHKKFALVAMALFGALMILDLSAATLFSNQGGIANTRHNMSQSTLPSFPRNMMNSYRNDYGEVCVYCHTPHGSQTLAQMPLWNRTVKATTYTTYNSPSLTQTVSQPGNNSRMCLTCHDGQTAIDSIINMPGSGMGLGSQATTQNNNFLQTWVTAGGVGPTQASTHLALATSSNPGWTQGCLGCHNPSYGAGTNTDFTLFNIGTDLTNDHPVGIDYPAASGVGSDFNLPSGAKGTAIYFDADANGNMDKGDVRLYNTGGSVKVECASCHDPHGVPDPENSPKFKPSFLRVANNGATGSALCLTCHDK